jgi:hypothetical protein
VSQVGTPILRAMRCLARIVRSALEDLAPESGTRVPWEDPIVRTATDRHELGTLRGTPHRFTHVVTDVRRDDPTADVAFVTTPSFDDDGPPTKTSPISQSGMPMPTPCSVVDTGRTIGRAGKHRRARATVSGATSERSSPLPSAVPIDDRYIRGGE